MENLNRIVASKPEKIHETETYGEYVITGLYPGYGHTLGNALRRMLLSSIQGVAITSVRIKGALHEFSTLDGISEDVLTIILNIKNIKIKQKTSNFPLTIKLQKKGKGTVTAGDFKETPDFEIVNKNLKLAEIGSDKTELEIDVILDVGIGYEKHEDRDLTSEIGLIHLNAAYSPIKKCSYEVKNVRVGKRNDFNKLAIAIETDGTLSPASALENAIRTIIFQCESILGFKVHDDVNNLEDEIVKSNKTIKIKDLKLSPGVINALNKEGVEILKHLTSKTITQIKEIPGIGDKAIEDLQKELANYGITLNK